MKILVLCTGNSCRSQMAEGILKNLHPDWTVFSAGTDPAKSVHPLAVEVMREIGIDISDHKPKMVDQFINESFDYVLTVCDSARESCPVFTGQVKERRHHDFFDPALATGNKDEKLEVFRRVRDEIHSWLKEIFTQ